MHTGRRPDSCGEAFPRVGRGTGNLTPPLGEGGGNGESTAKDFHLFSSIFNQKMIISGFTCMLSLYIIKCFDDLSISCYETGFKWVILTFDFVSRMKLPNSKDELNFDS